VIVVGWKWAPGTDDGRAPGTSAADRAALEIALRLAAPSGDDVVAVSVGPAPAERGLREALAAGATRAVRVDAPTGLAGSAVAAAIGDLAAEAQWVVCGDASADRGTGSVPAFVAARLGVAQALGLVALDAEATGGLRAVRRLDGGRREVLAVEPPAVLSVEGAVARLRRATLPAELAARRAEVEVIAGPAGPVEAAAMVRPYRPRPRERPAPQGAALDRVRRLTATGSAPAAPAETVVLDPPAAADRILRALRAWGYLPQADSLEPGDR
jgi:electron transfer flavoprotein beta subunit